MKEFIKNVGLFCVMGAIVVSTLVYFKQIYFFPELRLLKKSIKNDISIILLGSSVNKHVASSDKDRRSISEILGSLMPERSVVGVSHSAYSSDIYLEFVRFITKKTGSNPVVIVPINLRYFSPEWDLRPAYKFIKERYLINGLPYFFNWKYEEISPDKFKNSPVYYGDKPWGKVADYLIPDEDMSSEMIKGFIFHYMQPLKKINRKLKSLEAICKISKEHDLNILMYITPIDYAFAEQLKIVGFRQLQYENVNTIKSALAKYEIEIVDLSMLLNSSYFDHGIRPSEHLNMNGRREVATALSIVISHVKNSQRKLITSHK